MVPPCGSCLKRGPPRETRAFTGRIEVGNDRKRVGHVSYRERKVFVAVRIEEQAAAIPYKRARLLTPFPTARHPRIIFFRSLVA